MSDKQKKNVPVIMLNKFEIAGKDGQEKGVMHAVSFGDLNAESVKVLSGKVSFKVEAAETPKETAELQRKEEGVAFIKLFKRDEDDGEFSTKLTGSIYTLTDEKDENGFGVTKDIAYVSLIKNDSLEYADYSVNVVRVEDAERVSELKKSLKEAVDEEREAIADELNSLSTSGFASVTEIGSSILNKMEILQFPKKEAKVEAEKTSAKKPSFS